MQLLIDLAVGLLTGYLALTSFLADQIHNALSDSGQSSIAQNDTEVDAGASIGVLNSEYPVDFSLPDILIKNAAYQNAAVITGMREEDGTQIPFSDALVNIYCTYKTDEYTRTNTGTGFFINDDGVVLTNAHVAQFLLLETVNNTGETTCILRAGNPATPLYEAELLYISPAWIQKNADLIDDPHPRGSGERDFALLYVTAGLNNAPMPATFPHLRFDTSLMRIDAIDSTVTLAGYPANDIDITDPNVPLYVVETTSELNDMFTFGSQYADIIAIASSTVGGNGASGGPVLNADGKVIGLITTKGGVADGPNSLRALTLSYIDRTIIEESTFNLENTASGQLAFRAKLFTETIGPFLSRILESELE